MMRWLTLLAGVLFAGVLGALFAGMLFGIGVRLAQ